MQKHNTCAHVHACAVNLTYEFWPDLVGICVPWNCLRVEVEAEGDEGASEGLAEEDIRVSGADCVFQRKCILD